NLCADRNPSRYHHPSNTREEAGGLAHPFRACTTATEGAPPFAVFKGWEPRTPAPRDVPSFSIFNFLFLEPPLDGAGSASPLGLGKNLLSIDCRVIKPLMQAFVVPALRNVREERGTRLVGSVKMKGRAPAKKKSKGAPSLSCVFRRTGRGF